MIGMWYTISIFSTHITKIHLQFLSTDISKIPSHLDNILLLVFRLKTTLCLQYKPQYIAAGSLYLAAKLHNIKLPLHGAHVWWHQFDVAPKPLEGMWSPKWIVPSLHSVPFGN